MSWLLIITPQFPALFSSSCSLHDLHLPSMLPSLHRNHVCELRERAFFLLSPHLCFLPILFCFSLPACSCPQVLLSCDGNYACIWYDMISMGDVFETACINLFFYLLRGLGTPLQYGSFITVILEIGVCGLLVLFGCVGLVWRPVWSVFVDVERARGGKPESNFVFDVAHCIFSSFFFFLLSD
ncbi:hypothetical protein DM02DRAFT_182462 [Periconia macrospinosa]|uniref:Uncharacterized protein n=1 Tax=Periconia macrospinosa TaxID=97972 RepID=A0A2V1D999_9PLEO|nr:hypothetical protein DM02DRAFT_182462 [Periconia macrospinosa]